MFLAIWLLKACVDLIGLGAAIEFEFGDLLRLAA
jgi:hypothetical protein